MSRFFIAILLGVCIAGSLAASLESSANNSTSNEAETRSRLFGYGYGYGYSYYNYYNWYNVYQSYWAPASSCGTGYYSCPSNCAGTCGLWSGLGACQVNSCGYVGNVCSYANIQLGYYLHPYAGDNCRYVQCDSNPGRFFIRSCPAGLVFDARFSVCNYAYGAGVYWGRK